MIATRLLKIFNEKPNQDIKKTFHEKKNQLSLIE